MNQVYYSYDEFIIDTQKLLIEIKKHYKPDAIVGIARGGCTLAHFIAELLDIRELYSVGSKAYDEQEKMDKVEVSAIPIELKNAKKILLVDDLSESGDTLYAMSKKIQEFTNSEIKTATIFSFVKSKYKPNFFVKHTDNWIHFFWNTDLAIKFGTKDKNIFN